jgi:Anti-sigma-K factor rskA
MKSLGEVQGGRRRQGKPRGSKKRRESGNFHILSLRRRFGGKMTESSNHWQELLAGYVLGNLSSEELIQFKQYLDKYPENKLEVERLQKTLALLPLSLEEGRSPNNLKARIRASAQSATEELELSTRASTREKINKNGRKSQSWQRIWTGIAVATIALLGWQTYHLQQQVSIAEAELIQLRQAWTTNKTKSTNLVRYQETVSLLHQPNNRLLSLTGSKTALDASGSLVIVPDRQLAVLVLQNVPNPPQNKIYQMWAVVNGRKVSCIKFKPDRDGTVLLQIPITNWLKTPMVVITLEQEEETTQPKGDMVMSSPQV